MTSDAQGAFRIGELRAGSYRLEILPLDGLPFTSDAVDVRAGLDGAVEITLPRGENFQETVTVTTSRTSSTAGSVISTVPSSPARTTTGSLANGTPSRGSISRRYDPARNSPIRKAPRASLVAQDAVSRAHTRTPPPG